MNDLSRTSSLKQRLVMLLLPTVALAWLATAAVSYFDARHEVDELLDAHLAQSAGLLIAQQSDDPGEVEVEVEHRPREHKYGHRVAFQVWEKGAVLRLRSANAPRQRLSTHDEGFSDVIVGGVPWRVFSIWDHDKRFLVQMGEEGQVREEIAGKIARNLLAPLLVALPALGVLIWLSVARGVQPLAGLGIEVGRREPGNLAPLMAERAPAEVMPLVDNLNRLFERVRASMENERRFTADAAHELRTPLAALKTQAEVARGATSDAERRQALDNVIVGCNRATHLVQQLLTLARLEPNDARMREATCDLNALARSVLAELAPAALEKNVALELRGQAALTVAGDPGLIHLLLRNLVDNAVRYSPGNTQVLVETARDVAGRATLTVVDQGPGISIDERDRIGRRFYRSLGSGETGSGLGLSIVKRIAEMHGAAVDFSEGAAGRGLRVTLTMPIATPAGQP